MRIVLADDADLLREALASALTSAGFDVVGQAPDVPGLLALVESTSPDVVVVDVRMPPTHTTEGLEAAREIRSRHPGMAILVLSQYVETRYAVDLLRDDPSGIGYLLKDRVADVREFVDAVRRVAAGGTALDREVVAELVGSRGPSGAAAALQSLTPREQEVLGLMAEGRTNAAIARALVVTLGAVEKHISNIFAKFDLPATDDDHRRVLAVLAYLEQADDG
jgi:DNA-binding NarL/FixJ family response regulator